MINRVVLVGRLTRDPESQYTPNGIAIAKFTVAINNSGTISASTGTIGLDNGGSSSGIFSPGAAGTINFSSGNHTLLPASSPTKAPPRWRM